MLSSLKEIVKGAFVGRIFQGSQFSDRTIYYDTYGEEFTKEELDPIGKLITNAGLYSDADGDPGLYLTIEGVNLTFYYAESINTTPKPLNWDETF